MADASPLTSLGGQITSAIQLALAPATSPAERHNAYLFLQQCKDAHAQTWEPCWALFLHKQSSGDYTLGQQERMFCLQVVGESLPSLSPEALAYLQRTLFEYFASEYINQPSTSDSTTLFLKNAAVHLTTLLFLASYPTLSPAFLSTLLSFPATPSPTDLLLRILHEISDEISDVHLRLNKPVSRLNKDAEIRDAVRERDATAIVTRLWEVLGWVLGEGGGPLAELEPGKREELAVMAMKVVGDYVSWIDINLIITPETIPFLLQALHHPSASIRIATATTLIETVGKGMPAADKLSLLTVLNLQVELAALVEGDKESEGEVRETGGRLLNAVGLEICKIVDDSTTPAATKASALATLQPLLPLFLVALSSASTSTSLNSLTPFANALLTIYKKDKKRNNVDPDGGEAKKAFMTRLLECVVRKMEYSQGHEWTMSVEGEEDEDELVFAEMRKNLTLIVDAIAWIDPPLFSESSRSIVISTLDLFETRSPTLTWQRLELALYLLHSYSTALQSQGPGAFVIVPPEETTRAKREPDYRIEYTRFPLSPLGEMMVRAVRSKACRYPHAAVNVMFWEVTVRYHDFFRLCPEYIAEVLPSFLDEFGLHQEDEAVKALVFYLFSRFIILARGTFQSQVSADFVADILNSVQDLLAIETEMPADDPATVEQLTKVSTQNSLFDSQLHLFEAVGTLISVLNQAPSRQVELLRGVIAPLLAGLEKCTAFVNPTTHEDFAKVLEAHHRIMAIGNIAKGFPDLSARSPVAKGEWAIVFKEATEAVLVVSKTMGGFICIRNAARFFFNRIVATTGNAVLPLIPMLIDCLLGEVTFPELSELLSFLGLLVAKYKLEFLPILDTLLMPVFTRVFHFLKLPIAGTDDTIAHSTLRRAYFNFILSIIAANLQEVFYSEKNKDQLQNIFQSITHYIATDSLAPDQRFGFSVLNRFLALWVMPYRSPTAPATNGLPATPVPGFEQFLYLNAVKLCFEVPLKSDFDYSDAQSYSVIGEIANLLKGLLQKRGPEFVEFMNGSLLPSMQCPPEAAERFMTALQEAPDGKQFKKFASEWLRSSRGAPR